MSFRQSRYIHVQTPNGAKRGFTVLLINTDVSADAANGAPVDMVEYSIAMCSKGDAFCRATARTQCAVAEPLICRILDLPLELAKLHAKCMGYTIDPIAYRAHANHYAWVWKYFL